MVDIIEKGYHRNSSEFIDFPTAQGWKREKFQKTAGRLRREQNKHRDLSGIII